ncbi:hypothetical protein [Candidatus Accumulibacter sp. ACC012]|uniref:hypothetical protein n=1 Tax=Candidatus Accumulibacter sp. ACC012 TaxID=2823332 RepID=UPI0025BB2D91|nr:hypothetical protein [Candidatus Accumulibacter sp. ACC012]
MNASATRSPAIASLAVGGRTLAVDEQLRELTLVSDTGRTLWRGPLKPFQASVEASGQLRNDCPLLSSGDRVADGFDPPGGRSRFWRQPPRRYDYEQISGARSDDRCRRTGRKNRPDWRCSCRQGSIPGSARRRAEFRHGVELHAEVVNNLLQGGTCAASTPGCKSWRWQHWPSLARGCACSGSHASALAAPAAGGLPALLHGADGG